MEIRAFEGPFGAEVLGLDLAAPLSAREREEANRAFVENVVLCFRGQAFDRPEDFLAAVRNLGDPMPPVTATYRLPGFEVIEELTNRAIDRRTGDRTPLMRGGSWHTDHSNLERPPKATVLYAIEVPEEGATRSSPTSTWPTRHCRTRSGRRSGDAGPFTPISRAVRPEGSSPARRTRKGTAPDAGSRWFASIQRRAAGASISIRCVAMRWRG